MNIILLALSISVSPLFGMLPIRNSSEQDRDCQREFLSKKLHFYNTLVSGNHENLEKFPLKQHVRIEYELSRETPLLIACASGHAQCAQILIDAGAPVNQKYFGKKPLTLAAENLYYKTVKTLIKAGAKISDKEWVLYRNLPTTQVQRKYHKRIVRYLFNVNKNTWLSTIKKRYLHE